MVAWQNAEALRRTLETRRATFWSRSRGELWEKGATSGNVLDVEWARLDCDGDTVLLGVVAARPGLSHGRDDLLRRGRPAACSRQLRRPSRRGATPIHRPRTPPASCTARASTRRARSARRPSRCCWRHRAPRSSPGEVADLWFHTLLLLARDGVDPLEPLRVLRRARAGADRVAGPAFGGPTSGYPAGMPISDELRSLLADPRQTTMLRERAERVFQKPITLFTEADVLAAWAPLTTRDLARELLDALAFAERLDPEELALIGELAMVAEDCYRAWSADLDTDGAEWRQVAWSYTERRGHRSMVLHVSRWDGQRGRGAHVARGPGPPDPAARPRRSGSGPRTAGRSTPTPSRTRATSWRRPRTWTPGTARTGEPVRPAARALGRRRRRARARRPAPCRATTRSGSTSAARPAASTVGLNRIRVRARPVLDAAPPPPRGGGDLLRPRRDRAPAGRTVATYEVRAGDCLVVPRRRAACTPCRPAPTGLDVLAFGERRPAELSYLPRAASGFLGDAVDGGRRGRIRGCATRRRPAGASRPRATARPRRGAPRRRAARQPLGPHRRRARASTSGAPRARAAPA